MKPTQKQIDAALRYVESRITDDMSIEVQTINALYPHVKDSPLKPIFVSANILADAYRELQEENKRLKPWADLAIQRFERACELSRKENT